MKLYFKALKMHLMSELEYKSSFIMSCISQTLSFFSYLLVIVSLFGRFALIDTFSLNEVLLCFAIIRFGFTFNETFARGIDKFDRLIVKGNFDLILLRPKNIILQILISEADFVKLSRLIEIVLILIYALIKLNVELTFTKVTTLILMLLSSIAIFFGIFLLAAAYCFITIQGLEVRNIFTNGGKEMAQYPISIFNKPFVIIFTVLIPYAFINYYPLLFFLGRTNNLLYAFSPLIVFIYLIPCFIAFNLGVKKYTSVGC